MSPAPEPRWVAVGRIARAHGVKGELSVLPLSSVPSRFDRGSRLFVGEGEDRALTVARSRPHGQRLLVRFEGVGDRDRAEVLQGEYLFVPAAAAPPLPDGEYWSHQLIGCEMVTERGHRLGWIREVAHTPANDVWIAASDEGEALVPALKDVIASVDVVGRRVVVREVPGLTVP